MTAVLDALERAERALADLRAALVLGEGMVPPTLPSKLLTQRDLEDAARALDVDLPKIQAVKECESGPLGGFGPDGRCIILFEPHVFSRLTNHRYDSTQGGVSYPSWGQKPYPPTQEARWDQLKYAVRLDKPTALQSASYGLFQIMGFNYAACGFPGVDEFFAAMQQDEREHLLAFVNFIKSKGLDKALRAGDWLAFATGYNGTGQAPAYAAKLEASYKRFSA